MNLHIKVKHYTCGITTTTCKIQIDLLPLINKHKLHQSIMRVQTCNIPAELQIQHKQRRKLHQNQ